MYDIYFKLTNRKYNSDFETDRLQGNSEIKLAIGEDCSTFEFIISGLEQEK